MKTLLLTLAVVALGTPVVFSADWNLEYETGGDKFAGQELSIDVFGLYGSRDRDNFSGGTVGLGAGVNYFFTENFGAGTETYMDDFHFPRHIDVSFLARYPLEELSLAPYAMVGLGRQYHDVAQWTAHIGAGADFRLNRGLGLFTDVRHYFADRSKDFFLWRLGVRLVF